MEATASRTTGRLGWPNPQEGGGSAHAFAYIYSRSPPRCGSAQFRCQGLTLLHITVRPAVASEREALEALQWRASLNNPNDREALLANPDAIELPLQQILEGGVFVAEQEGKVIGFSAILPREDGDFDLDALFVEPECWRQGVGRVLVEQCAIAARHTGAASLHVVGNPHAEHFYTACGFEVLGTEHTRFGVGLLMKRALQ